MSVKLLLALVASLLSTTLAAQLSYPENPVHIVVPYPPGGGADIQGRILAQQLTKRLKQTFLVENRPGAGSNIGTAYVAKSAPDGYRLLLAIPATVINPTLWSNAGYDARRDLTAVAGFSTSPLLILAHPSVPVTNVRELIAYVKANPGKLNFASGGTGAITHVQMELMKQRTGIELLHIVFQGQAPAVNAVAGGHVSLMADSVGSGLPFAKSGRLRALGITSRERWSGAPDIPTLEEQGFADLSNSAWYGLMAPAGTPAAVLKVLSDAVREILGQAETVRQLAGVGAVPFFLDTREFQKFADDEGSRWAGVLKNANIKAE